MDNNPATPREHAQKREWPERVLIANVSRSERDEAELELLPAGDEWEDLPTASYVRAE